MTVEKSRAVQRNMEDKKMEVLYGICSGVEMCIKSCWSYDQPSSTVHTPQ